MKKVSLIFLLLPLITLAQNVLTVHVVGVESNDGSILIGVYDTDETFLEEGKEVGEGASKASMGETIVTIKDLPNGTYALAIFHDENDNEELDINFLGIPKEPLCFSIGKLRTFGPPLFKECAFRVEKDTSIKVEFE
ncbi:DUF2141 domain-containing protein [Eudoraea sp.]|uniref:DUF2141 domain-containing protein n=1 Tax=Eudoraea sp. TaxID=1979955 RepID=UPI003C7564CE